MILRALEGEVERVYRSAGLNPAEPERSAELARRILGAKCIRFVPAKALPGEAALARVGQQYRIYLRQGLSPQASNFAIAHELAHFILKIGVEGEREEQICDAMAACLVAPRRAYRKVLRCTGECFERLSNAFEATESCMALRFGEVTGKPVALVTPTAVRVRGGGYAWPSAEKIRALSDRPPPNVRLAPISDQPRRFVLRAG